MPEHIDAHTVIILNEYSKLHKNTKIIATLPSAEEALANIEALNENINEQEERSKNKKNETKGFFKKIKEKLEKLWS